MVAADSTKSHLPWGTACSRQAALDLPEIAEGLRSFLSAQLGARWSHDGRHFDVELEYARSAASHLRELGVTNFQVRPAEPRPPLVDVVDRAISLATQRQDWTVNAVEILEEQVAYLMDSDFAKLDLRGSYTVRVTQAR